LTRCKVVSTHPKTNPKVLLLIDDHEIDPGFPLLVWNISISTRLRLSIRTMLYEKSSIIHLVRTVYTRPTNLPVKEARNALEAQDVQD
jgi:hypothetical protein